MRRRRRARDRRIRSGRPKKAGACSSSATRASITWLGGQLLSACWRGAENRLPGFWPVSTGGGLSGPMMREPEADTPVLILL